MTKHSIENMLLYLAEQFADVERFSALWVQNSSHAVQQNQPPGSPADLACGNAAIALFFAQLDQCFPNRYETLAHQHLMRLFPQPYQVGDYSLYSGLAGACTITLFLSRQGQRYTRLLQTLEFELFQHIQTRYTHLPYRPGVLTLADYDLISGGVGLGVYLLLRLDKPEASEAASTLFRFLLSCCRFEPNASPLFIAPTSVVPPHREKHPHGYTVCGMAHGVAGVVTIFAYALQCGLVLPDLPEMLERLSFWLVNQEVEGPWGKTWPAAVDPGPPASLTYRDSWCYGPPAIAWALWQAGKALHNATLQERATEAILAVCRRPDAVRGLPLAGLCHGAAGLLHTLRRFQQECPLPLLQDTVRRLREQVLSQFDPASCFGWKDQPQGVLVDNPGFLSGASGVALALLATITGDSPVWDRLLLLSGGPL